MSFVAITIPVLSPISLTVKDGAHAQAAIYALLTRENSAMGQSLHNLGRHKPMTLALLPTETGRTVLRLTFMGQDASTYLETFVNGVLPASVIRIGHVDCRLGVPSFTAGEWSGICTWADLMPAVTGCRMRFVFASPTAFTKRDGQGGKYLSILPEPLNVFTGLLKRWESLGGPDLLCASDLTQFISSGGCVLSEHHVKSSIFENDSHPQLGFMGWAVYTCLRPEPRYITALSALTRLAFFTGVGYQTMRGMGAVRTTVTD